MKKIFNRIWLSIRSNPKKFFIRVGFLVFLIWFLFDDYGLVKRFRMEAEHRMLLEQQRVGEQKVVDNELRIHDAHQPDSIEKAARERYNFRKQGETLFIIKK